MVGEGIFCQKGNARGKINKTKQKICSKHIKRKILKLAKMILIIVRLFSAKRAVVFIIFEAVTTFIHFDSLSPLRNETQYSFFNDFFQTKVPPIAGSRTIHRKRLLNKIYELKST